MPRWDYKLSIKELWQDRRDDDADESAKEIAPEVARRVRHLSQRVSAKKPVLSADLQDMAEGFEDVPTTDEPSDAFNAILNDLYDLGDAERIWIG